MVAPEEVRLERAGARGTLELEGRSGRQLSQEEKARRVAALEKVGKSGIKGAAFSGLLRRLESSGASFNAAVRSVQALDSILTTALATMGI